MQQNSKWDSLWREGRQSCLLLIMLVLLLYWPALNDTVNTVDDPHILNAYGINGHHTLARLFLPSGQFYYRPFIELSFYLDNLLWGLEPRFMHLENVLLHLFNTLLVYTISKRITALSSGGERIPLVSALIFALHPINTESVNWIAGRTDPLAAVSILLSLHFLLKGGESGRVRDLAVAGAAFWCALLTKETAVMLAPASLVLLAALRTSSVSSERLQQITRQVWWGYGVIFMVVAVVAGFRVLGRPTGSNNAFSMLIRQYDLWQVVRDCFTATGFYLKKLLVPVPLNFAIDVVHPAYAILGVLVVPLCWYLLKRRNIFSGFLLSALLFMIPPVVVMCAGLNWTPVAERYLYIPSAFFAIWCAGCIDTVLRDHSRSRPVALLLGAVVMVLAAVTFQRNLVWRDNLSLFEDAVKKSPRFGDVRNDLGLALVKAGRYDEAREHFEFAVAHAKRKRLQDIARMNLLNLDMQGKDAAEKIRMVEQVRNEQGDFHEGLLILHNSLLRQQLRVATKRESWAIYPKLVLLNDLLYRRTADPHYLYYNGQYLLILGEKQRAYQYFADVVRKVPFESELFVNSTKLMKLLDSAPAKQSVP
ncbi:glycosyltransferase family 39 protein [Trichlorobacter ammonificans]|uniref:Membrane protein n=1 Tax=Trichlorobacter ammonificans TaxID=2916410 RepID=A0ABM9D786_9BACT|nr:glycosyltransferase family 39 protein [Trichlorobacter ammonificans]CAH2031090.1 putative Membrane protein [Trichlorobacter ammonificans]